MKRTAIYILVFGMALNTFGQVEFRKVETSTDMDEVWKLAAEKSKPVFVDIFATWCGPCKWLDSNVFSQEPAGNYMNETFINVKMDGESPFGRSFAMQNGLNAYPSLFVFNAEKEQMNKIVGAKPWDELYGELVSTLEFYPVLAMLQDKYDSNILSREEYPAYVKALREMGHDAKAESVVNRYRMDYVEGSELSGTDIQVLAFFTEQNTDEWTQIISDIPLLVEALGDDLEIFAEHALRSAIESAVDWRDIQYIERFNEILPKLIAGTDLDHVEMETRSYVYYYHYSEQFDALIDYIDSEFRENREGDHEWLYAAASDAVFLNPQNTQMARKGLEWFQTCIDLHPTHEYYYNLALCQYFTDSPDQTIINLKKSLEYTDDPEVVASVNQIIEELEGEME